MARPSASVLVPMVNSPSRHGDYNGWAEDKSEASKKLIDRTGGDSVAAPLIRLRSGTIKGLFHCYTRPIPDKSSRNATLPPPVRSRIVSINSRSRSYLAPTSGNGKPRVSTPPCAGIFLSGGFKPDASREAREAGANITLLVECAYGSGSARYF